MVIEILKNSELTERKIPGEPDHFEVIWELNENPSEKWIKEFEGMLKKWIEKEGTLIGLYKPRICFNELISTIISKDDLDKQKAFFIKEFFEKINKKGL